MYLKSVFSFSARRIAKKYVHKVLTCRYYESNPFVKSNQVDMQKFPIENIRNFGIIAHIDHGKSTLSDRLMEFAGNIPSDSKNEQVLDKLQVERERGITVKAQTVSLFYQYKGTHYLLNLIDTPGHVDFSFEVLRSLTACQGVLLLVDANQGVQAQTMAHFNLAFSQELEIIPVLNKIDLKRAVPELVAAQLHSLFGFNDNEILKVSAKTGVGIQDLVEQIIERIPPPTGDPDQPFRGLLYDSWYSKRRGVIGMFLIVDGRVRVGDEITSSLTGQSFTVKELGILFPEEIYVPELRTGQAGFIVTNLKDSKLAKVGDTWFSKGASIEKLPSIEMAKPMVFSGLYPSDQSKLPDLRKAIDKLLLNDSSVHVATESNPALGHGWRLGFLGLLHMEVFCQRLDLEFDAQVIVTAPAVPYKVKIIGTKNIKKHGTDMLTIVNPLDFPIPSNIVECYEPMVLGTIVTPASYYTSILKLCMDRRGEQKNSQNIDNDTMVMVYEFPLNEIIVDFFDELKSITSGFASFDYEETGYKSTSLIKLDILLNGTICNELSIITHTSRARSLGQSICLRLKEFIEPHQFQIAIQAAVGGKVVARENIKPLKKNVVAKLYGGDNTRRMKLLERQKEGKKRMRMIGNIQVPRDTFIKVLKR